ncbi:MAG: S-adenosyl-L-homocysteine hydrolase [Pseudomonadota bacterium]|nr:S-adenosyl-L-homocysteine hydrolase [Pseudomonadota bacterium]
MTIKGFAACVAAAGMVLSFPAAAGGMGQAEKIRRLDIMLMVTGLRCRTTADDFQREYGRFTTNHIGELNAAARELRADYAARLGPAKADRALDKLSVQMANQYGQGHPWLNCGQLKQVATTLADMRGLQPLVEAANDLLDDGAHQMAWLR